jgi:hypothetical protein
MALAIILAGLALEGLILGRGIQARLFLKYPFFYFHVLVLFVVQFPIFAVYFWYPAAYPRVYWFCQFLTMVTGCGVIVEIIRRALAHPGMTAIRRTASALLALMIGGFITAYFLAVGLARSGANGTIERDFRTSQALLLVGILLVVFHYGLPVGRNIRGMFVGYGLYITCSLITLALMLYGRMPSRSGWNFVQPLSCIAELTIWAITLWTYNPNIILEPLPQAEVQYAP